MQTMRGYRSKKKSKTLTKGRKNRPSPDAKANTMRGLTVRKNGRDYKSTRRTTKGKYNWYWKKLARK
jgi:hypothetical protein